MDSSVVKTEVLKLRTVLWKIMTDIVFQLREERLPLTM